MRKIFGKYATRRYREVDIYPCTCGQGRCPDCRPGAEGNGPSRPADVHSLHMFMLRCEHAQKTGELAARLDGILGRGDDQHCTRSESLQWTLEETIRVLKDAKERGQPRDQPEGASQDQPWGDAVVTAADAAVAAADWRAGLLSSRALFCVELAVDAAGRATHATMAALGKGAQEFFQSSPWGDMHGHVFYNLIHPEDRPKLDALLRQHAHGTGQGSVTRLRLVHFRTCQLEMNLWNQVPAHDASLAAANSAPDTGWPPSWDNVLPDDPLLDDAAGAVPRCTPSGMGDVKVTRGKTFFTAAHIALDFQLVAKHDAGGGLAGGIMVVMAPLHTATPPLRSCSAHLVCNEQNVVRGLRAVSGIYQMDASAALAHTFMEHSVRVEAPRTSDLHDAGDDDAREGRETSATAVLVWENVRMLPSSLLSVLTTSAKFLLSSGARFLLRFVEFHIEPYVDADGLPCLAMHLRLSGRGFVLPWYRCINMDLSGNRAFPMTRNLTGSPGNQSFFLPVWFDNALPPPEAMGFCVFWCQPRGGEPLGQNPPGSFSQVPCEQVCGLVCGTPHAVNYVNSHPSSSSSSSSPQWKAGGGNRECSIVKTRCAVGEAAHSVRFVRTGEFDEALATRDSDSARWTHWMLKSG